MINQVIVMGVLDEFSFDKTELYLRVKRNFKNQEGEYVDDCITVKLPENMEIDLLLGRVYAVKCRIVSPNFYEPMQLVAEKISSDF